MSNGRRRTYSPEISADIEAKLAALTAELDALAAWACDQYDDGDEQFGRRAGVARGRELLAERDALKAELTRVRDLAEKDRAAFADTLCSHRTALRETREALIGMTPPDGPGWWCPTCREVVDGIHVTYEERHERCGSPVGVADGEPFEIARAVLARHAGLVEGGV